jgi:hypothetical protein
MNLMQIFSHPKIPSHKEATVHEASEPCKDNKSPVVKIRVFKEKTELLRTGAKHPNEPARQHKAFPLNYAGPQHVYQVCDDETSLDVTRKINCRRPPGRSPFSFPHLSSGFVRPND